MEVPSSQETCTSLAEDGMLDSYSDVDDIKVISTQIIHLDLDVPVGSSVGINTIKETPEEEKRRKRINKVVGFCAALIFLTCVALVCSSLMRAKSIDELVRQSNVLLRDKVTKSPTRPHLNMIQRLNSTI